MESQTFYTLVVTLLLLGSYTTYLQFSLTALKNQFEGATGLIFSMAKELQSLGSPNVSIEEIK
jgi:hypothetical protein